MILMKSAMSDDGCLLFALILVFFQFRNFYVLYIRSIINRVTKSKFMLNGGVSHYRIFRENLCLLP